MIQQLTGTNSEWRRDKVEVRDFLVVYARIQLVRATPSRPGNEPKI